MARITSAAASTSTARLGFEAKLWLAADKLRNNMDAAEYKHVVLGLIFLKYISDTFEEHRAKLVAGQGEYAGANAEDPDEYKAENVFWVPAEARWSHLQANAKQPTIGKTVDDAMVAIERDKPRLKGVFPKDYARPGLDKHRLGELIDLIGSIELGNRAPSPPAPLPGVEGSGRPGESSGEELDQLFPDAFQDSELGRIPKGWAAKRLPEVIEVNPRRTLKRGNVAPYLDMKNLPTQAHSAEEIVNREFSSGTKFQNGDTLLARITPCLENGKTGFVDFLENGQVGWGSTEYIILAPKPSLPPQFGYLLARSDELRSHAIQNMTGTSNRQRVPSECFNTFWLAVPPPAIAQRFNELTAPLMAHVKSNSTQSRTLATLRDTLLPKLLSGELRVTETGNRLKAEQHESSVPRMAVAL